MSKGILRKQMKAIRDGIPVAERRRHSQVITRKVLTLTEETRAKTVFTYLSFGSEVETHALIQGLLDRHIQVAVPRCDTQSHTMEAVAIKTFADLNEGTYGILEPQGGEVIPKAETDLILVPALAFDRAGYRLGYGGGYYDRYLKDFCGVSVGLAFSACCVERLPRDCYDLPVSRLLTEE